MVVGVVLPACCLAVFDKMFDTTVQEPDPYIVPQRSSNMPAVVVTFQYHKVFLSVPHGNAEHEARLCVKHKKN
jgi:hypothetical protein